MDLLSGYSDNALAGFNGYTPQNNAAIANNNATYQANQDYIKALGQQTIDQQNANWAATNPATNYGHVGNYPSFGDPAAPGTYSPGNAGGLSSFSGTSLQQPEAPANNPYNPYADRPDAAPQYDADAYRKALAETMAAYQQPQQPQAPAYSGGGIGSDIARAPYQNDPMTAPVQTPELSAYSQDAWSRMLYGDRPDISSGDSYQTPGEKSWGDWFKQYQMPAGPQPGDTSMNPSADWLRGQLTPKQPTSDISSGDSFYNQPQSWGDWFKQYQMPAGPQPGDTSMSPAFDAMRKYFTPEQASTPQGQADMEAFYKTNFNQLQQPSNPYSDLNSGQVGGGYNPYAGSTRGAENFDPNAYIRDGGYDVMRQMQQPQAPVDTQGSQGWPGGSMENYFRNPGQGPTDLNPSAPATDPYGNPLWNGGGQTPYPNAPFSGGLSYNSSGQLDQSDPGNIAYYNQMMRGGGSGATDFSAQSRQPSSGDPWQSAVPKQYDTPGLSAAVHEAAGVAAMDPNAYAALIQQESTWNPREGAGTANNGMGQIARDDFKLGGGTLNGMTYDQYLAAPAEAQLRAHGDLLNAVTRNAGINMQNYDARTQYAIGQALNFGPWSQARWLPAFLAGDTSVPTTSASQGFLGTPSIADLQRNYDRISGGWNK